MIAGPAEHERVIVAMRTEASLCRKFIASTARRSTNVDRYRVDAADELERAVDHISGRWRQYHGLSFLKGKRSRLQLS
jgi:hypothetical protein